MRTAVYIHGEDYKLAQEALKTTEARIIARKTGVTTDYINNVKRGHVPLTNKLARKIVVRVVGQKPMKMGTRNIQVSEDAILKAREMLNRHHPDVLAAATGYSPLYMRGVKYGGDKLSPRAANKLASIDEADMTHNIRAKEKKIEPRVYLPPVQLLTYRHPVTKKGDEEEACLHLSDGHAGKITVSFDDEVYRMRMDTVFDGVMTIITLHRHMYPIRKLHILITGDNIQGENAFQGSKIGSVSMGARDQTVKIAYPAMVKLIGSLAQEFEEVVVDCIGGNHGKDRLAPETSTEDLRLYDLLKVYFQEHKGIKVNVHDGSSAIINLNGFRSFMFHGDKIKTTQGIPLVAINKKLMAWYHHYGGFQYAFGGHFHKRLSDEISSKLEYFMCGSLVSDDDWAIDNLGISSNPSQNLYGVHPRYGVTWRYAVQVDRKFLPERTMEGKIEN